MNTLFLYVIIKICENLFFAVVRFEESFCGKETFETTERKTKTVCTNYLHVSTVLGLDEKERNVRGLQTFLFQCNMTKHKRLMAAQSYLPSVRLRELRKRIYF